METIAMNGELCERGFSGLGLERWAVGAMIPNTQSRCIGGVSGGDEPDARWTPRRNLA
jgi:hypothetical protein